MVDQVVRSWVQVYNNPCTHTLRLVARSYLACKNSHVRCARFILLQWWLFPVSAFRFLCLQLPDGSNSATESDSRWTNFLWRPSNLSEKYWEYWLYISLKSSILMGGSWKYPTDFQDDLSVRMMQKLLLYWQWIPLWKPPQCGQEAMVLNHSLRFTIHYSKNLPTPNYGHWSHALYNGQISKSFPYKVDNLMRLT